VQEAELVEEMPSNFAQPNPNLRQLALAINSMEHGRCLEPLAQFLACQ
jgi:hypothetical protein